MARPESLLKLPARPACTRGDGGFRLGSTNGKMVRRRRVPGNIDQEPFVVPQRKAVAEGLAVAVAAGGHQHTAAKALGGQLEFPGAEVEGDQNAFLAELADEQDEVAARFDRPIGAELQRRP